MCHLFGRATKAVSICPPAYYADILCTRARVYLANLFDDSDTQSVVSSATSAAAVAPDEKEMEIKIHADLMDSMFYI